ncbi:MAG: GNAT family N-acetyltransferase [Bacteroidetes bacterium]|nr:GNAT family N-acetyltransferase [Bacteroidota bacterium]
MNWLLKKFEALSVDELYAILQLRNEVFAIEQNCVYPDMDNKDQAAYHLMCFSNNKLIAYSRIIPPGIAFKEASIGRVVTSPQTRRAGIGKLLMQKSIESIYNKLGKQSIRIGAQYYLIKFYTQLGFTTQGEIYLEDGIEHIEMVKS